MYSVGLVGILGAVQKLPAMVIFIVHHEQDWHSAFHDLTESDDSAIGRLVERPRLLHDS